MSNKPLEIKKDSDKDALADQISDMWHTYNTQRIPQLNLWKELRNYVFATDTSTTTNKSLPWKNSTTLPKLCQIRDNLHSNYLSALFPNDDWLQWEAYSEDSATKAKALAIEAYMSNKTRESYFRTDVSQLIYDYIDMGNAFVTPDFESSYRKDEEGTKIANYIGPRSERISPYNIVFNPLSRSFKESWKIVRYVKSVGELYKMVEDNPDNAKLKEVVTKRKEFVKGIQQNGLSDDNKRSEISIDGFGSYEEYMKGTYFEMLVFYGDIYDPDTGEYRTGRKITVIDQADIIIDEALPSWLGYTPIFHVGWRTRQDNLWAMGPLENLVGMQYRIDHLENLKADAMDLAILPPLVIAGEVEAFDYAPGAEIHIDENGTVTELARNVQWVISAEQGIDKLEMRMEQYAGAPREAMGIRSAGEKTAFEIQQLQNAAGRIFQEKVTTFEIELLEPLLNGMLEMSRRNLDGTDVIRVMNGDLGFKQFMTITREDISASGVIRPVGARHFAAQAQMVQNLVQLAQTPIWQQISQHTSAKKLALIVEDLLNINRFELFRPNVAVFEQQETQRLAAQATENLLVEQSTPPPIP